MLIIVDNKIPALAKEKLARLGEVAGLMSEDLTYPAISGHPDIFFCQLPQMVITSPNLPGKYFQLLDKNRIRYAKGTLPVGSEHPLSIHYNAAANDHYLIHRLEYTDPLILENAHFLKKIPVKQGYTRCNLVLLKKDHFITSDAGIMKTLSRNGFKGLFIAPEGIVLPGFSNGFIGGTMGILHDTVHVLGNFAYHPSGGEIARFLNGLNYRIDALYDGPLFDGGGILFLQ